MKEYKKENIKKSYLEIWVLDAGGSVYDYITGKNCPQDFISACKKVIELIKDDKELRKEYGCWSWSYLVVKNEEDDDTNWQTFYKVYKYANKWKYKRVDY